MKSLKILESESKTMSSLEIAKLTGKEHSKVTQDIERILNEAKIGHAEFRASYLSPQNKELPCFNLPRRECDLVVSGYSVPYRLAIIDRWQELEVDNTVPDSIESNRAKIQAIRANSKIELAAIAKKGIMNELQFQLDVAKLLGRSFDINQYVSSVGISGQSKETLQELKTLVGSTLSEFGGIDKPHLPVTTLLKDFSIPMRASDFNEVLVTKGILSPQREIQEYGKRFGFNAQQGETTQPRWYTDRFEELLTLLNMIDSIGKLQ